MSLFSNGGCLVAMCGKDCVAIATDTRFGIAARTIATDFQKVFKMDSHMLVGFTGLQSDMLTVYERTLFRKNIFEKQQDHKISPENLGTTISTLLYEHRFAPYFVETVIASLPPTTSKPYICFLDTLGSVTESQDYVAAGAGRAQLYGLCEMSYKADLDPDALFEVISQVIMKGMNRESLSGCGATVYVIEKDKLTTKWLKTRTD